MAAFNRAVRLGYRYLETDVHATADGILVVFHDATLDRVTDRTGTVAEMPWRELRMARIGGVEPIPLLVEVLERWPHVRVNIDPKSDAAVQPLVEVIQRTGAIDRV
jgi:glycerophosphoryl diester phosphodiesterase